MPLSYGLSGAIFEGKMEDGVQIITIPRSKSHKKGGHVSGLQGGLVVARLMAVTSVSPRPASLQYASRGFLIYIFTIGLNIL